MNAKNFYGFALPQERIALRPMMPRHNARLMVIKPHKIEGRKIRHLSHLFKKGDHIVLNDTKVLPYALTAQDGHQKYECLLLGKKQECFHALMKPARKLHNGQQLTFAPDLTAQFVGREGRHCLLRFNEKNDAVLHQKLKRHGVMPLPPYIAKCRPSDARDKTDYQTSFAKHEGSVAAPTAGLHVTSSLLRHWKRNNIRISTLTLHVGEGTFLPMHSADLHQHHLHKEWGEVSHHEARRINETLAQGGRLIAVGTTSLRLLESAVGRDGFIHPFCGETSLFIKPHHQFRTAHCLLTNFHLPYSTLFVLVCAFAGMNVARRAYMLARSLQYRFYSYGDGCLIYRAPI